MKEDSSKLYGMLKCDKSSMKKKIEKEIRNGMESGLQMTVFS